MRIRREVKKASCWNHTKKDNWVDWGIGYFGRVDEQGLDEAEDTSDEAEFEGMADMMQSNQEKSVEDLQLPNMKKAASGIHTKGDNCEDWDIGCLWRVVSNDAEDTKDQSEFDGLAEMMQS